MHKNDGRTLGNFIQSLTNGNRNGERGDVADKEADLITCVFARLDTESSM